MFIQVELCIMIQMVLAGQTVLQILIAKNLYNDLGICNNFINLTIKSIKMNKKTFFLSLISILITFSVIIVFFYSKKSETKKYLKTDFDVKMEKELVDLKKDGKYSFSSFSRYSFDELIEKSDLIVIGIPTNNFKENKSIKKIDFSDTESFYTKTPFVVLKKVKDRLNLNIQKETIFILQPSAIYINENTKNEKFVSLDKDFSELKKGSLYILFLQYNSEMSGYVVSAINSFSYNLDDTDKELKKYSEENADYRKLKEQVFKKYEKKIKEVAKNFDPNKIIAEEEEEEKAKKNQQSIAPENVSTMETATT